MERTCTLFLKKWLTSFNRKPLVIRGARQVGKTWLVRDFAKREGKQLIEINLERTPDLADLFSSNEPQEITKRLSRKLGLPIEADRCILFLDEIQEQPHLYGKLRWFAEDMPQLPVIAAGSLLELVLGEKKMSMPVGRIGYLYLEPLSFIEYLLAAGKTHLVEEIREFTWNKEIHSVIHKEIMKYFKEYLYIGGMPEAVSNWTSKQSLEEVNYLHESLLASYREDFNKYRGRIAPEVLNRVVTQVPQQLGKKFVYSHVDAQGRLQTIKKSFDLLCQARVCHKVLKTDANGLPLGAEADERYIKALLLDVGLCSSILGLSLEDLQSIEAVEMINKGGIAEQVTGQLLRTINSPYSEPQLYYWQRPAKGPSAEIDFVIQDKTSVIPVEVKAGARGTLRSLHYFMERKHLTTALRIFSAPPQKDVVHVKGGNGTDVTYELRSLPFYLISEAHRLLD